MKVWKTMNKIYRERAPGIQNSDLKTRRISNNDSKTKLENNIRISLNLSTTIKGDLQLPFHCIALLYLPLKYIPSIAPLLTFVY